MVIINDQYSSTLMFGDFSKSCLDFTFVVPTYNRLDTLALAIDSIFKQSPSISFEIVVVDNCSDSFEQLLDLIKSYNDKRLILFCNEMNYGQISNWNIGINLAKTDWVVLLHDDDMIHPDFLIEIKKAITHDEHINGIVTLFDDYYFSNSDKKVHFTNFKNTILKHKKKHVQISATDYYFENGYYAPTAAVYKKSAFLKLHGFDNELYPISDMDFHIRYMNNFGLHMLPKILAYRGIGVNESLELNCQIQTLLQGRELRVKNSLKSKILLGNWWIESIMWYKLNRNYMLDESSINHLGLDPKYNKRVFQYIYLCIYRFYCIYIFLRR